MKFIPPIAVLLLGIIVGVVIEAQLKWFNVDQQLQDELVSAKKYTATVVDTLDTLEVTIAEYKKHVILLKEFNKCVKTDKPKKTKF